MKLSLARLADLAREDVREVKKLDASKKGIQSLDDLSACVELERLDLSHNNLRSLEGIADCHGLKWLNVASNQLEQLTDLKQMTSLTVLNASTNAIRSVQQVAKLTALRTLILSSNDITAVTGIECLVHLNTLVLSKNKLETIAVSRLTNLVKLSLSHNEFHTFPDVSTLHSLKELRLNDNKINCIPESIYMNARLVILDIGNNRFRDFEALQPLRSLKMLTNLNLKGNHVCSTESYIHKIVATVQHVKILDGKQVTSHPAASLATTFSQQANTKHVSASKQAAKKQHTRDKGLEILREPAQGNTEALSLVTPNDKLKTKQHPIGYDPVIMVSPKQQTRRNKLNKHGKRAKEKKDSKQGRNSRRKGHVEEYDRKSETMSEAIELNVDTIQHSDVPESHNPFTSKKLGKKRQRDENDGAHVKHKKQKLADRDDSSSESHKTRREHEKHKLTPSQPIQRKGKSALKTKESGVVSIQKFPHKRRGQTRTKSKSSTFEPNILLQSMQDIGVGGQSAWL